MGDDAFSYGCDGERCKLWHDGPVDFGEAWSEGDVVGCFLDLDEKHVSFAVNGTIIEFRGQRHISFNGGGSWFPALTLKAGLTRVNFGGHPLGFPDVLEDYVPVELARARQETPLLVASLLGNVEDMQRHLDAGAKVDRATADGKTPLWSACYNGHVDAARLLLDKGAEVDRATEDGRTPLLVA